MADAGEETDDDVPEPVDDELMTDDDLPVSSKAHAGAGAAEMDEAEEGAEAIEEEQGESAAADAAPTYAFNASVVPSYKSAAYLAKKAASSASRFRQAKVIVSGEQYGKYPPGVPAYPHIRASSSQYPRKRYCDVTHYPAAYTDPRTRLHYVDALAFAVVRTWGRDEVNARLALRRAQPGEIK